MRRVLNLLQATAMSAGDGTVGSSGENNTNIKVRVDGKAIYLTSGSPLPEDVNEILELLLNEPFFSVACEKITTMCSNKGYALADVLKDLALKIGTGDLRLDAPALARLLDGMSQVEDRLASGTDEKIQTASLVGVFVGTRQRLEMV